MVEMNGKEIAEIIKKEISDVRNRPELHTDLLYNIGSILISVGLVKNIPTLVAIGKNIFVLPDRFRYWFLSKHTIYGASEEVTKTFEYINNYFEEFLKALDMIAELIERGERELEAE